MESRSLKAYGAALSTIFSILLTILNAYANIPKVVPGLSEHAVPLIVWVLLIVAIVLQWDRIAYSLVRYPTASRLSLWALAVAVAVFTSAVQFKLPKEDVFHWVIFVSLVVIGVTVIHRHSLEFSATTQYIGEFPANLPTIIEVVQGANTSIKILTDVFAYGAYSDTSNYNRLITALEQKSSLSRVKITWCSYTGDHAKDSVKKQLRLNKLTEDSTEARTFLESERMKAFVSTFPGILPPRTLAEFIDIVLVGRNKNAFDRLSTIGCKMLQSIEVDLPLFIWIIDSRVAVFCIQVNEQDVIREDAFITRDPALLAVLEKIGNVCWRKA